MSLKPILLMSAIAIGLAGCDQGPHLPKTPPEQAKADIKGPPPAPGTTTAPAPAPAVAQVEVEPTSKVEPRCACDDKASVAAEAPRPKAAAVSRRAQAPRSARASSARWGMRKASRHQAGHPLTHRYVAGRSSIADAHRAGRADDRYAAQNSYRRVQQGEPGPYDRNGYVLPPRAAIAPGYDSARRSAQSGYAQGGYVQGGYAQGGYVQRSYSQSSYSQGGYTQGGYDDGGYAGGYVAGGYSGARSYTVSRSARGDVRRSRAEMNIDCPDGQ